MSVARTPRKPNRATRKLSHFDDSGHVQMVDVSEKPVTERTAVAGVFVRMRRSTLATLRRVKNPKGDPLEVARIAGISAAKRTAELIPLCHPLMLTHVDVRVALCQNGMEVTAEVTTTGPTGVEMEALVAASVPALTIYDMCKAVERGMTITDLCLLEKKGGRSGHYLRTKPGRKQR